MILSIAVHRLQNPLESIRSQETIIGLCPEPDESNPYPNIPFP
jgi:hypothetical protein